MTNVTDCQGISFMPNARNRSWAYSFFNVRHISVTLLDGNLDLMSINEKSHHSAV